MERRQFGRTDMMVSTLGFGGAEIGRATVDTVDRLLGSALDAGLNVIDTAECYGDSEELIGKTVSHRRSDYYLFTKCGHSSGFSEPDWDPKMLAASIDRSLKRLSTDHVDLLQLHSCSSDLLRSGEVIEVLQRAKSAGKTRYIGYSGDGQNALTAVELGVFDSLQTSCNIADQECIELTIGKASERGMGVIAKRPIANVAWRNPDAPSDNYSKPYWERLNELKYAFLTAPLEVAVGTALRFTLSVPGVNTAIVGTQNPNRWVENARLLEAGKLTEGEYTVIRSRWRSVAPASWVGQV